MVVYSEDWDEEGEEARNERRGDLFVFNNTNSDESASADLGHSVTLALSM